MVKNHTRHVHKKVQYPFQYPVNPQLFYNTIKHGHQLFNKITSKQKPKEHRSYTQTKTDKKEKFVADDLHSGMTNGTVRVRVRHPYHGMDHKAASWRFTDTYPLHLLLNNTGQQFASTLAELGTVIQAFSETAAQSLTSPSFRSTDPVNTSVCLAELNPSTELTGSVAYPGPAQIANNKFYINHSSITLDITSFSPSAQGVDLYVMKSTSWHNSNPETAWAKCLTQNSLNSAQETFPATGAGLPGYPSIAHVGLTPKVRGLSAYWKILKVHHINLSAAANERFTFNITHNLKCDLLAVSAHNPAFTQLQSSWNSANVVNRFFPGSIVVMMVGRGIPQYDTTALTVTYAAPAMGCIVTRRFNCKPNVVSLNAKPVYAETNAILTLAANNGNQKEINITDAISSIINLG